jgi:hypothetical protein
VQKAVQPCHQSRTDPRTWQARRNSPPLCGALSRQHKLKFENLALFSVSLKGIGQGDYLKLREELFADETVESLYQAASTNGQKK